MSRERQRKNRKLKQAEKRREEQIERYNAYGVKDLTAYNAVMRIRKGSSATIAL